MFSKGGVLGYVKMFQVFFGSEFSDIIGFMGLAEGAEDIPHICGGTTGDAYVCMCGDNSIFDEGREHIISCTEGAIGTVADDGGYTIDFLDAVHRFMKSVICHWLIFVLGIFEVSME